jgi:putative ABC transport system substrate-binding protein
MSRPSATVRTFIMAVLVGASLLSASVHADEPPIPRIGALVLPLATSPFEEGLRDGLRELGYIEGKNIVIEWRRSGVTNEELRLLAADLTRSKVQVIVVYGTPATRAVLEATTTIPVVFGSGAPVESGLAASLARPGGNATGVSVIITELTEKRLELLHQVAPRARRIAYLTNSSNPIAAAQLDAALKAARTLGLELLTLDARNADELDTVLGAMVRSQANGVLIGADPLLDASRSKIAAAVRKARLPAISPFREYHDEGVLLSYGTNQAEVGRKMAVYVDKILKGAKPSELPIEQMSKYDLIIDLRVAREMGIHVPQELLLRADEVIR